MILVLLFHARVPGFRGGFIGVDVFFVLSGFLIGSILVRELRATGRVRLGRFFARRFRRLLPAAVVVLVTCALVMRWVWDPVRVAHSREGLAWASLYGSNWHFWTESLDYFAHDGASPVLHFWSLSVEEQFYLAFPLLLVGLKGRARGVVLLTLASLLAASGAQGMLAYFGTHTRMWQPLAGAALALAAPRVAPGGPAAAAGLVLVVLAGLSEPLPLDALTRGVVAVVGAVLLIGGLEQPSGGPVRWVLEHPLARWIGDRSYGLYLWHWPVLVFVEPALPAPWTAPVAVTASFALAALSHRLVEMPIRQRSISRPGRAVAAGMAAAVLTAGLCLALTPVDARTRALLDEAEPVRHAHDVQRPGPTLLLAGDCHVDDWGPPLAELAHAESFSLVVVQRRGCSWFDPYQEECLGFQEEILAAVAERHPERVLLVAGAGRETRLETGLSLVPRLLEHTDQVQLLEPSPVVRDPVVCLAMGESDCDSTPGTTSTQAAIEAAYRSIHHERVESVDLDALICPDGLCRARVWGRLTHIDSIHLAPAYSRSLQGGLARRLGI